MIAVLEFKKRRMSQHQVSGFRDLVLTRHASADSRLETFYKLKETFKIVFWEPWSLSASVVGARALRIRTMSCCIRAYSVHPRKCGFSSQLVAPSAPGRPR